MNKLKPNEEYERYDMNNLYLTNYEQKKVHN